MTKTKIDMHNHSTGSDGHGTPKQFVKAVKKAGLDGMVITDHHKTTTQPGIEVCRALQDAGYFAMLGCEYSTKQGHLLIYGINVDTLRLGMYPDMATTIERVLDQGGVCCPAHPYKGYRYSLGSGIYEMPGLTHCEVLNGQNQVSHKHHDQDAQKAAGKLGLHPVGGSDAHWPDRIGTCWTEFDGTISTPQDLVEALASGQHKAAKDVKRIKKDRDQRVYRLETKEQDRQSRIQSLDTQDGFWKRWGLTHGNNNQNAGQVINGQWDEVEEEDIPWWAYEKDEDKEDARTEQEQSWAEEFAEVQAALRAVEDTDS